MTTNPALGVLLHGIGGFAAGSFYAPLKKVKRWAWESSWLVMGVAAWIVAPWFIAWLTTPRLIDVLSDSPRRAVGLCVLFGLLWGIGGLTFGLTMRYLGIALGMAVALGFCMTFGTLVPPVYKGLIGGEQEWAELMALFTTPAGVTILTGVSVCLVGIGFCGWAGVAKEGELTDAEKRATVREFALGKGFLVASVSGILSACFAFGLSAGAPIAALATAYGTPALYSNNAVLVVILLGGFASNALWCLILNARNHSFEDYITGRPSRQWRNYTLSALGGVIWYGQFFFYGMGTTTLGERYHFSSWSIHMAFIIVFSNLWGIAFREWRGTSTKTRRLVWGGILTLIISTVVIGYGNYQAG